METAKKEKGKKKQPMKIATIPLKEVFNKGKYTIRAKKSIFVIKKYVSRHTKTDLKNVRIGMELNELLWEKGIKNPPRMVKVQFFKKDKIMTVNIIGIDMESREKQKEEKMKEKKQAKLKEQEKLKENEKLAEEETTEKPDEKAEVKAEEKTTVKSDKKTEVKAEEKTTVKSDKKTEVKAEEKDGDGKEEEKIEPKEKAPKDEKEDNSKKTPEPKTIKKSADLNSKE